MSKLLDGVRVLESGVLMGADHVGMVLADLGADVVKVEEPIRGDYLRDILGEIAPRHSPAHLQFNKGKRSLALDLKQPEGLEVFWKLHATCDVFVDGNLAGACDRLSIGYEDQRSRNPAIIYCENTAFGSHGPYAGIPAHGEMMAAAAGGRPVLMDSDGLVRRDQAPPGLWSAETGGAGPAAGGIISALYIAAALVQRHETGTGCRIDVSAVESVIGHAVLAMTYGLNDHRITDHSSMPARDRGNLFSAKYQYYQTKDEKYVMFACMEPKFWTRFCASVDRPDLAEWNENPHVPVDFGVDQAGQRLVMQEVMHTRTLAEWMDLAAHEHLPIGPAYNDVRSLAEDPHVKSRGMFVEGEHPIAGPYTYVGESAVVEGQPFALGRHAPTLGEHTREILGDIGIPSDRMSEWIQTGVIA